MKQDLKRISQLESRLDYVETELGYLNKLLVDCGFPNGVETLKSTIEELLQEAENLPPDDLPNTAL